MDSSREELDIVDLASNAATGRIDTKYFTDRANEITLTADDVVDVMVTLYSNKNKSTAHDQSMVILNKAKSQRIRLSDISFAAPANFRCHKTLKHLVQFEGVDANAQENGRGKTIFSSLMEQYDPERDEDFLKFLIGKEDAAVASSDGRTTNRMNFVNGLEGELGNLLLFALRPENRTLIPGGYERFRSSFGTGLTHRADGVATPLVTLFSNPNAMDELLQRYEGQVGSAEALRSQLANAYQTFPAEAAFGFSDAKGGEGLESPYHTPTRHRTRQEERQKLTPDRESVFSGVVSPNGGGHAELEPGAIINPSRSLWQKLCDCFTKGGRG